MQNVNGVRVSSMGIYEEAYTCKRATCITFGVY